MILAVRGFVMSDKSDITDISRHDIIQQLGRTYSIEASHPRHMSQGRGRKRRHSTLSSISENWVEQSFGQPEAARSVSQASSQDSEDRPNISIEQLRRVSRYLEQREKDLEIREKDLEVRERVLEIRKLELDIEKKELDTEKLNFKNDKLELELVERRRRIMEGQ
ncbi:hypothetical protein BDV26DRAFT_260603 [Aspergillus bertholletiae]|uniref:Uncharacterized protein n=1 Tax=Aspergillus bertholletiae TaxID=1226010 RepID=A0A5N7BAZ8_9EURO|nr:hypothetical protein BDV26DRAFT_260603 [Aspergillus bertholletiae]